MGMLLRHKYGIQGLDTTLRVGVALRNAGIDTLDKARSATDEQLVLAGLDANDRADLKRALERATN